jgi:two-component system, cell cycle sensor histidine kinase and response regulator CckA
MKNPAPQLPPLAVVEQLRQENEARLTGLINSVMDAIISVNEQQQIVLFNPAAEQMFDYAQAEIMGQSLTLLIPARFHAGHEQHVQRFGKTSTTTRTMGALGAISGVRKNGEEFPIEASISQVEANGQKLFTVILRDITRRKQAEDRLQQQAALLNQAREAIISCNLEGRVQYWNHGAEQLYGWTADEVMGRDMSEQIHRDQLSTLANLSEMRSVLYEKGEWSGEQSSLTKDRRAIIVESRMTLVRDEAGQPKSILIIKTDITEKKQLEAQFLRAQRMESIGTLAGGIAHDLNNVLSPLSMGLQMMQMKYADEYAQKMLGMMNTNVQRGAEMVKQILQFARGVGGERIALQPKHIVKELLKMVGETFPKSIAIKQQLGEEIALVLSDATQLHQVLLNLCVNARDAMPLGGTLTISLSNEEIKASYPPIAPDAKPGRYVVLSVADTGEGIAPEHLERIFDPFFTTKEQGKGTGLGLSTVFGIVRAHDGFITVESAVGRGTQFKVHLPAHVSETVQPAEAKRNDTPVGQGELILVVDDEAAIREMNRAALETYGYRVLTASDGATAIALYAQHQAEVQLVLTDVMMPVMDGLTMIRALRSLNPKLRVICCSGTAGVGQNETLAQLNVQRILTKPLNVETLLHAVTQALNET